MIVESQKPPYNTIDRGMPLRIEGFYLVKLFGIWTVGQYRFIEGGASPHQWWVIGQTGPFNESIIDLIDNEVINTPEFL